MDSLQTTITAYPVPTLLVVAAVVVLSGRMRAQCAWGTLRELAVVLACYLFAFVVISWADGDETRMWLLAGVLAVIAVGAVVRIVGKRSRRPAR